METGRFRAILGLAILLFLAVENEAHDCSLRATDDLSDMPPLIINPSAGSEEFVYPTTVDNGYLVSDHASAPTYRLVCPGAKFSLNGVTQIFDDTLAYCNHGENFLLQKDSAFNEIFDKISCSRALTFKVQSTGRFTCRQGIPYEVGYPFPSTGIAREFFRVYDLCIDRNVDNTIYAHGKIRAVISSGQQSNFHPSFQLGGLSSHIPTNAYSRKNERDTLAKLMNDPIAAQQYIPDTGESYFARGHLMTNSDLFYIPEQRSTYLYANVLPMWQSVNNGNWKRGEAAMKDFAAARGVDLDVWAGGIDILQLEDTRGRKHDIYIHVDKHNFNYGPVPKILFKVARNPSNGQGVVFLTANNPRLQTLPSDYVLCTDVSQRISWRSWNSEPASRGLSYACEIDDFRRNYPALPFFTTSGLLV